MATITAADVNKLRTALVQEWWTARKALVEAEGDFELGSKTLEKDKSSCKPFDRESTEGAASCCKCWQNCWCSNHLNCETDFVWMKVL
jgi:elongation factor Ts